MIVTGFWDDADRAQDIIEQVNNLKGSVNQVNRIEDLLDDLEVLILLGEEDEDNGLREEIKDKLLQ
ncbi:MAG: peptide chain release factor 2, partial [Firmicutes bacterium HGW-Firmicutes-13]